MSKSRKHRKVARKQNPFSRSKKLTRSEVSKASMSVAVKNAVEEKEIQATQASVLLARGLTKPQHVDQTQFFDDKEKKLEYLEGLVSKQLDLYDWCEEKVSTLATIDAILLGGATILIDKVKIVSEVCNIKVMAINGIMTVILTVPFFISLAIALWHIRPKMGTASTNAPRPNHRSSNGIRQFKTHEEYKMHLESLSVDIICEDLSKQIYGMNKNIWKNQKSIKNAVFWDLIGLVGFLLIILYQAMFL